MTRLSWLRLGLAWAFLPLLLPSLGAEEKAPVIAKSVSPEGTMLRRTEFGQPWHLVKNKEELTGGETVLGLHGAVLLSKNGAIRVSFLSDINGISPYPVRETSVVLPTDPTGAD